MAQATWEKPVSAGAIRPASNGGRWKFLVGGALMLAAVAYLIVSGTLLGAQYFMTVDDLVSNPEYVGQPVRIAGVVLGDSIQYDSENLIIDFTIANLPNGYTDLAQALFEAANNPDATRLSVHIENEVKPDLLQHEAQAILSGTLDENGVFQANELLLKCPTRFVENGPDSAELQPSA